MGEFKGPRQLVPLDTVLACVQDLQHLSTAVAFNGLEEDEKQWQLREFCTGLIHAVKHPSEHLRRLDAHFSQLLPTTFIQSPHSVNRECIIGSDSRVEKAANLLARFPRVPQRLFTLPFNNPGFSARNSTVWEGIKDGRWADKYLIPEARAKLRLPDLDDAGSILQFLEDMQDIAWNNLFVTSFVDTNNCVFLLKVANLGHKPDLDFARSFESYVTVLGELVDEYDALVDAAKLGFQLPFSDPAPSVQALKAALFPREDFDHEQSLSVLKAFLWSAWQRSVMLYFYYVIGVQLWQGGSSTWSSLLAIRGVRRLIDLEAQDYRGDSTPYLCNWAFELLRTTRTSLGMDFRRMIFLFDSHFQGLEGRCIQDSGLTCRGDLPESCQRFTGAESKSQSVHALTCDGICNRIRWSENSYRNCENPRAVRATASAEGDHGMLNYAKASARTMAISHVWSHGQGGRPEDGINKCLHKRYCDLAISFGCDSYWIDSACIPDDHQLRKEAIMAINDIFCNSRITLISDKDLQSKALIAESTEDLETLLSILLVCDWGVRAWTMLEAIRGNESLHILCANDQTIRLVKLLQTIYDEGAVDLAVLLGSVQHLLPSTDLGSAKPIEEVGHLLSQRHASRENDEIIIWGLLSSLKATTNVMQFWKANENVNTAFLMSSAPRLKGSPGYGWAPETPYVRPQRREVPCNDRAMHVYSVRYPSYDGRGSYSGRITSRGLQSFWLVHELEHDYISELCSTCVREMVPTQWIDRDSEDRPIQGDYDEDSKIYERPDYASACFLLKALSSQPATRVRIIRPLSKEGTDPYQGNVARGENFSVLVAICLFARTRGITSSPDKSQERNCDQWHWKGVYEWIDDSHPDWVIRNMRIV